MYFKYEEDWQKKAIREIAKKYGIDIRVVRQIVYYPFLFMARHMADTGDAMPIRHRHLGVFLLKKRYEHLFSETKQEENS